MKKHSAKYLARFTKAELIEQIQLLESNLEGKSAMYERCAEVNKRLFEEFEKLDKERAKQIMNSFVRYAEDKKN
jgi:hypothetical protein